MTQRKRTDIASFLIANSEQKTKKERKRSERVQNRLAEIVKLASLAAPTVSRRKSIYDFQNKESIPMIFICTTLWHEEDNEMTTLLMSLLRNG